MATFSVIIIIDDIITIKFNCKDFRYGHVEIEFLWEK